MNQRVGNLAQALGPESPPGCLPGQLAGIRPRLGRRVPPLSSTGVSAPNRPDGPMRPTNPSPRHLSGAMSAQSRAPPNHCANVYRRPHSTTLGALCQQVPVTALAILAYPYANPPSAATPGRGGGYGESVVPVQLAYGHLAAVVPSGGLLRVHHRVEDQADDSDQQEDVLRREHDVLVLYQPPDDGEHRQG